MSNSTSSIASNQNFLIDMLQGVAFIRAFEEKVLRLTQTKPPLVRGSVHLCAGQEVVPLAALAALEDSDQITCTYRGHGWAIAAGIDPYAIMAEICHREDGLNGGRAGSAYMMAPDTRFIGENSIVGAGTTIACGAAIANLHTDSGRLTVVTIGDGAMNQGAVHEAMAFAAARKLPILFVVENNGWSELTETRDMFQVERLASRAKGYGIPSATIDGTDPIIVRDSFAIAAQRSRAGEGPSLLECTVPRLWGHYHADLEHYRSKENREAAVLRDPLVKLRARVIEEGLLDSDEAAALIEREVVRVEALAEKALAAAPGTSQSAVQHVFETSAPASAVPIRETQTMTYIQAVNVALRDILTSDPMAICYGEDVGKAGGIFQASRYLQRDFGADRVFDTPIAENAILGSAVGAAMSGLHPIVEIMWSDFLFVAFDQLVNQAANVRYITRGNSSVPMVVRTQQGVTPGSCAQHSRSVEAFLAHVPGLKVAVAATASDAYALLRAAAADPDPCVVLESRGLYQTKDEVNLTDGAEPVGLSRLRREGRDIAIVTWGTCVPHAIAAAEELDRLGIDAAVLDLRWISPLDEKALKAVIDAADGRVLVVHEAAKTCGFGAELIVRMQELLAGERVVTAQRLTSPDVPMPAAPELQEALLPSPAGIIKRVREICGR